jgi:hypothetical protein
MCQHGRTDDDGLWTHTHLGSTGRACLIQMVQPFHLVVCTRRHTGHKANQAVQTIMPSAYHKCCHPVHAPISFSIKTCLPLLQVCLSSMEPMPLWRARHATPQVRG